MNHQVVIPAASTRLGCEQRHLLEQAKLSYTKQAQQTEQTELTAVRSDESDVTQDTEPSDQM